MKARASDHNTNQFSVLMLIHTETKMRQNYVICQHDRPPVCTSYRKCQRKRLRIQKYTL